MLQQRISTILHRLMQSIFSFFWTYCHNEIALCVLNI
jgi:hypothetical protein